MSRSRKRIALWKDHPDAFYKRLVHRKNRRKARDGYLDITSRIYRLIVNPYDISDFSFWPFDIEDSKKSLRK